MKLHLPYPLRRALLACLAATALPAASIPTTIASASGIAAVFLAANARVQAEWPSDDEFGEAPENVDASSGAELRTDGTLNYTDDLNSKDVTVTLVGGSDEESAINVKLVESNSDREYHAGKLSLQGHIGDLLITGGSFVFDGGWEFSEGASVKDIYVKDAMLYLEGNSGTFQAEALHLGGRSDADAWEGALRLKNATVTHPSQENVIHGREA